MQFQLATQNQVRGDQLIDEIKRATGLPQDLLETRVTYLPPQTIEMVVDDLTPAQIDAIRSVVAAHAPNAQYFQTEKDDAVLWTRVRQLAQSAEGVLVNDLTAAQVKALLVVVLRKARALDKDGKVRALDQWAR